MGRWWSPKEFAEHLGSIAGARPLTLKDGMLPEDVLGLLHGHTVTVREVEGTDASGPIVLDFIASNSTPDRHTDTIDVEGWELDNFKANPVFLFAHLSHQPPIGKSLTVGVEDEALRTRVEFTPQDLNPFGHMIGRMFRDGFMNAVSVGFLPKEWVFNEERGPWSVDFKRQELLEISGVPVPANPEALIQARAAGIDTAPLKEWAERLIAEAGRGGNKAAEDIWAALRSQTVPVPAPAPVDEGEKELEMLGLTDKATEAIKALVKAHGTAAVSKAFEENPEALLAKEPDPPADPTEPAGLTVVDGDGKELSVEQIGNVITAEVKQSFGAIRTEVLGTV